MNPDSPMKRRDFFKATVQSAGAMMIGAAALRSPTLALAGSGQAPNPFALDVDHLRKVDPKLVLYETAKLFPQRQSEARRLCAGGEGRLYVAAGKAVKILDLEGAELRSIPCADAVRTVAVAPDGLIYAALSDHLEVFDAAGKRVATWNSPGGKVWFSGLAAGKDAVFAADAGNRVIWRYDREGKVHNRIGDKDPGRGVPGLIVPSPYLQVALGKDGLLRVNNTGRHQIEVYTADGDLEFHWGKPGGAIDSFCGCCNPIGFALLPDGRYLTCEKGVPRVKLYSEQGEFEGVVAEPNLFPENSRSGMPRRADGMLGGLDATSDAAGRIYVMDLVTGEIRTMTRKSAPSEVPATPKKEQA
jgi:hypothetical protein